jgi:hypothetical protein
LIESNGIPNAPHALEKWLHVLNSKHEVYLFPKSICGSYLWRSLEQMRETLIGHIQLHFGEDTCGKLNGVMKKETVIKLDGLWVLLMQE